jgi:hypothetical protein
MSRRIRMVALTIFALTAASGVWAGLAWSNARVKSKELDCCFDPTCPPGCSVSCPPDCTSVTLPDTKDPESARERRQATIGFEGKSKRCPPCLWCP